MRNIFIDPSYSAYYQNRLFDEQDSTLNRDDTLAPYKRLQDALKRRQCTVHTADYLVNDMSYVQQADYYSFGILDNYQKLASRKNVRMCSFVIFEPPVVAPQLYRELPNLTKIFKRVFVHNIEGDGYSVESVDRNRLHKLYWPQPRRGVRRGYWDNRIRERRVVVINGNHKPVLHDNELYSKRIEAMVALAKFDCIDLYGHGWGRWWARNSFWLPYWRHRRTLMSIYRGGCVSKHAVLANYAFSLCFENMEMKGYITEKIFDCLYSGTIPIYMGASDLRKFIPAEAYIDARMFSTWEDLYAAMMSMSEGSIESMRAAGRSFLESKSGLKFYNGLIPIFQT